MPLDTLLLEFLYFFICLSCLVINVSSGNVGCDSESGDICKISCNENQECESDTLKCDGIRSCEVNCVGYQACDKAQIQCSGMLGCEVTCGNNYQACKDVQISNSGTNLLNLICEKGTQACEGMSLTCNPGSYCRITCGDSSSCQNTYFDCQTGANCQTKGYPGKQSSNIVQCGNICPSLGPTPSPTLFPTLSPTPYIPKTSSPTTLEKTILKIIINTPSIWYPHMPLSLSFTMEKEDIQPFTITDQKWGIEYNEHLIASQLDSTRRELYVPPWILRAGYMYKMFLRISVNNSVSPVQRIRIISIEHSPLVSIINNGRNSMQWLTSTPLILNGNYSRDFDYSESTDHKINSKDVTYSFLWSCRSEQNLDCSSALKDNGISLSQSVLFIPPGLSVLKAPNIYFFDLLFTCIHTQTSRTSTSTITVEATMQAKPRVEIIRKGKNKHDGLIRLNGYVIDSQTQIESLRDTFMFNWTEINHELELYPPIVLPLIVNSPNLVIRETELQRDIAYKFRLEAIPKNMIIDNTTIIPKELISWAEIEIKLDTPPQNGVCNINPSSGFALVTLFEVSCVNWNAKTSSIQYRFSYQLEKSSTNSSNTERYPLVMWSSLSTISFLLPPGRVIIYTDISDSEGNYETFSLSVSVLMNQKSTMCISGGECTSFGLDLKLKYEEAISLGDSFTICALLTHLNSLVQSCPDMILCLLSPEGLDLARLVQLTGPILLHEVYSPSFHMHLIEQMSSALVLPSFIASKYLDNGKPIVTIFLPIIQEMLKCIDKHEEDSMRNPNFPQLHTPMVLSNIAVILPNLFAIPNNNCTEIHIQRQLIKELFSKRLSGTVPDESSFMFGTRNDEITGSGQRGFIGEGLKSKTNSGLYVNFSKYATIGYNDQGTLDIVTIAYGTNIRECFPDTDSPIVDININSNSGTRDSRNPLACKKSEGDSVPNVPRDSTESNDEENFGAFVTFNLPALQPHEEKILSTCDFYMGPAPNIISEVENLGCSWYDNVTNQWCDNGCTTSERDENGEVTCTCTHLTEFSVIFFKKHLGHRELAKLPYTVFSILYLILFFSTCIQTKDMVLYTKTNISILSEKGIPSSYFLHLLISFAALCRIISSISFILGFQRKVIASIPYLVLFWIYTVLIFQWAAIVHQSKNPDLLKKIFFTLNFIIFCTFMGLFIVHDFFSSSSNDSFSCQVTKIGSMFMSIIYSLTALFTIIYGYVILRLLRAQSFGAGLAKNKSLMATISSSVLVFSVCFLIMSTISGISVYNMVLYFTYFELFTSIFLGVELICIITVLMLLRRTIASKKTEFKKAAAVVQLELMKKDLRAPLLDGENDEGKIEKQKIIMGRMTLGRIFPQSRMNPNIVIEFNPGDAVEIQRSNGAWQKATVHKILKEEGAYRCHFTTKNGEKVEKDVPISCNPPMIRRDVTKLPTIPQEVKKTSTI